MENLAKKIKDYCQANYSRSYYASVIIECFTDEQLVQEFESFEDFKATEDAMNERMCGARFE